MHMAASLCNLTVLSEGAGRTMMIMFTFMFPKCSRSFAIRLYRLGVRSVCSAAGPSPPVSGWSWFLSSQPGLGQAGLHSTAQHSNTESLSGQWYSLQSSCGSICSVWPGFVWFCLALSGSVWLCLALSGLALSGLVWQLSPLTLGLTHAPTSPDTLGHLIMSGLVWSGWYSIRYPQKLAGKYRYPQHSAHGHTRCSGCTHFTPTCTGTPTHLLYTYPYPCPRPRPRQRQRSYSYSYSSSPRHCTHFDFHFFAWSQPFSPSLSPSPSTTSLFSTFSIRPRTKSSPEPSRTFGLAVSLLRNIPPKNPPTRVVHSLNTLSGNSTSKVASKLLCAYHLPTAQTQQHL